MKDYKLIDKFMGLPEYREQLKFTGGTIKIRAVDIRYYQSWDALTPVVEKIAEYRLAYPKQTAWVCDCKIVIKRNYLYREVVNFIKWYYKNVETTQP